MELDLVDQNAKEKMLKRIQQKLDEKEQRKLEAKKAAEQKKLEAKKAAEQKKLEAKKAAEQKKLERKLNKIKQEPIKIKAGFARCFGDVFKQYLGFSNSDLKDFPSDELPQLNNLLKAKVNQRLICKYLPASFILGTSLGLLILYFGFGLLHLFWVLPTSAFCFLVFDMLVHDEDLDELWRGKILASFESLVTKILLPLEYYYYVQRLKKLNGQDYFPSNEVKKQLK